MSVTSLKKTFGAHSHLFNATQTTATISDVTICDVVFRYVFKALYVSYLTVFFLCSKSKFRLEMKSVSSETID